MIALATIDPMTASSFDDRMIDECTAPRDNVAVYILKTTVCERGWVLRTVEKISMD